MYFGTKNYLKSTRNHTAKHALSPIEKKLGFQIVVKSMVILVRERASFGRLLMTGIRARLP
jgi:polysaccharide pyruvyl transferase WcaK-like protein